MPNCKKCFGSGWLTKEVGHSSWSMTKPIEGWSDGIACPYCRYEALKTWEKIKFFFGIL